jgi:hypothetical protein
MYSTFRYDLFVPIAGRKKTAGRPSPAAID